MNQSQSEPNLGPIVEAFLERYRKGERPSLTEYTEKYPEAASQIRELLPALVVMEELGSVEGPREEWSAITQNKGKIPELLGDYRILREVGRGGMGIVYEAVQLSLGRHVALKVLSFHGLLPRSHLERFQREARAAARLHHSNIVPVHGVGEHEGVHYYAMQFIQGQALDVVLKEVKKLRFKKDSSLGAENDFGGNRSSGLAQALVSGVLERVEPPAGEMPAENDFLPTVEFRGPSLEPQSTIPQPLPPDSASYTSSTSSGTELTSQPDAQYFRSVAQMGVQVARGLDYAHKQGILHRDIKPSNLLLDASGTVWITDFGLAKAEGTDELTHTGDIIGTLRYMAPERFQGWADPRSDVYCLGITLYEMLTLAPAFADSSRPRLIERIMHYDPIRPRRRDRTIPRDLETIVLKSINKEPSQRYQTAAELADDLGEFLAGRTVRARRTSIWERTAKWIKRQPVMAALLVACTCAIVALIVGAVIHNASLGAALEDADRERAYAVQARDRANTNLYHSLVGEIRATRTARGVGYRRRVWELLEQVRSINTTEYDPVALRHEAVGCLGDFTGFPPVAQPDFPAPVCALALRPGTEEAAFGLKDGTILLRHRLTGAESARLVGPPAEKNRLNLAFTPDGRRLASVGRGGVITVWEAGPTGWGAGREVGNAPGGRQALILPGGRFLAVPAESAVTVWDLDGGPPAPPFPADNLVLEVVPSADGTELIGATEGGLVVWDLTSRRVKRRLPQEKFVSHVAVSSNGRFLAYSVGDTGLVVLDAKTYQQRTMRRAGDVAQLAFDPAGSLLAAASYQDRSVPIWDVMANVLIAQLPLPTSEPRHLEFSADRRALVVAGPDGARTWDLQAADEKRTWNAHADGVCGLAFSPDGRRLVSTSHDRTAILWDVPTGQPRLKLTGFRGAAQTAAFSPNGRLLATADQEGPLRLWLAETGEELRAFHDLAWTHSYHVEFSPGGDYLAATGDGLAIWLCEPDPGQPGGLSLKQVASLAGTRSLHAAFSSDGRWLAWVDEDTKVRLWDLVNRRESPCAAPLRSGWNALAFQTGSHLLYFRARMDQWTAWDVDENLPVAVSGLVEPCRSGRYAAWGRRLLEMSLWDTETGRELFVLPPERNTAWKWVWSPTGSLLAAGLCSGEVVIWDIDRVRARLSDLGLDP